MSMSSPARIPFTHAAYAKLQREHERLTALRQQVLMRLQEAREMGDLSENGAYHAAKFELGSISRQLRDITYQLKQGDVVQPQHTTMVGFGSIVTLHDVKDPKRERIYTIVSQHESDPLSGLLSMESPLGAALMGRKVNETVTYATPHSGQHAVRITHITVQHET
jgi:transcription elongation factor GreA